MDLELTNQDFSDNSADHPTHPSIGIVKNLNHSFGKGKLRSQTLFNVNLAIHPGEFVMMVGPSGSGKSTLLSLMGCLRSVQSGSLQILGQELNGAGKTMLAEVRRHLGYVFQTSNLLSFLTAERNINMSLELHTQLNRKEICDRTQHILDAVGLAAQAHHYPKQLSGGQKQRVAIACALASRPQLILADEPTAALDSHSGRKTVELMHQLAKKEGSAVLMVTHDPRILDIADRIVHMADGHLALMQRQSLV